MHTTNTPTRLLCAKIVATLLGVGFAALLGRTLSQLFTADRGMVIHRLHSEPARLASAMFFDKMTALAQLTIALLGGTWALLTLADTKVKIKGWPIITCFILANASFMVSLFVYAYGYDFIVTRIFHHASFDVDAPLVTLVKSSQQLFFLKGCLDLVVTILVGRD